MSLKIKHIALTLFLVNAFLLLVNWEYKDPFASEIRDLDYAAFFFYIGAFFFTIYLVLIIFKKPSILTYFAITAFSISLLFNLHLARDNYKSISCNNGIAEYFEYETCSKMEQRFKTDLENGEIKYFQMGFEYDIEFEKTLKDKPQIEVIGMECTMYHSMSCYNDLVQIYFEKINQKTK